MLILLLRSEAIHLLNEITNTTDVLSQATHISLHIQEKDTRIMFHSNIDFEQKQLLEHLVTQGKHKIVQCSSDVWMIY